MHPDNPGVESYKQFKNKDIYLFPTSGSVTGMKDAMQTLAQSVLKLAAGSSLGTPSEGGYLPRGIRSLEFVEKMSANRAIEMLLKKIHGEPFISEFPIEKFEVAKITSPLENIKTVRLALATTAGVVPLGNPDGFKFYRNDNWRKYPLHNLNDMKDAEWEAVHGGYNTVFMNKNPNFAVPLDICRAMEQEGVFAELYPYYYGTTGVLALMPDVKRMGSEIADDIIKEKVDAVLLVST
jgi:glycine reductase